MPDTTTGAVPVGGPAPQGPADPKGELTRLKDAAQNNQAQIDKFSQANALVLQNIASLGAGISEVDRTVQAYAQSSPALVADRSGLQSFADKQMSIALAAIALGHPALDAVMTEVDTGIQAQNKLTTDLAASKDNAAAAQTAAINVANSKQADYDMAKATLPGLQAAVADAKTLQTQVNSAATAGNFGAMYVLLKEMNGILSAIPAPAPADLQAKLNTTLSALHAALCEAREKKIAADAATAALTAAQKKLNDAQRGRRAALLEAVKKWKAPAPPPAQPAPPGPQPAPPGPQPAAQPAKS